MELSTLVRAALERRADLFGELAAEGTDCVRLVHGATEGRPGLSVDRYGPVLLIQTWGEPLGEGELEAISERVSEVSEVPLTPVWNHRGAKGSYERTFPEPPGVADAVGRESGLQYEVRPRHRGADPLLFLDLRAGRRSVQARASGKTVLNLFAYTCGVGVAARAGGAAEVLNVDFARSALEVGRANAARNGFDDDRFVTLEADVIPTLRQLAGLGLKGRGARRRRAVRIKPRQFDLVVLDPPRWAKGPWGAVDVVRDYPTLLKPSLLATAPGGAVLATNHVASVALDDWLDIVRRCADKAGRPLRSVEVIRPEEDFPSPDGRPPLKMAWLGV